MFTVINNKLIEKLSETEQMQLQRILDTLRSDNEYLVVNMDEPYAGKVEALIKQAKRQTLETDELRDKCPNCGTNSKYHFIMSSNSDHVTCQCGCTFRFSGR